MSDAERDMSSLGVRTGGWVEVDVSAAAAAVAVVVVVAPGLGLGDPTGGGQRAIASPIRPAEGRPRARAAHL